MIFTLLPLALVGVAIVAWAWFRTLRDVRAAPSLGWRQILALAGLLASTLLAPLPYVMLLCFSAPTNAAGIAWSLKVALLLFLVSLPGAFTQRVLLCIGLILSSLFFLAFCGAIYAISGWQF
jgi:hypothetical protein